MLGKKVMSEKPLTLAEVRKILKEREKEGELNYEQKVSYEYVKTFGKITATKLKEAMTKLKALEVPEEQLVKIINICPTTDEELTLIFDKVRYDLEPNRKKLLTIAKELS